MYKSDDFALYHYHGDVAIKMSLDPAIFAYTENTANKSRYCDYNNNYF